MDGFKRRLHQVECRPPKDPMYLITVRGLAIPCRSWVINLLYPIIDLMSVEVSKNVLCSTLSPSLAWQQYGIGLVNLGQRLKGLVLFKLKRGRAHSIRLSIKMIKTVMLMGLVWLGAVVPLVFPWLWVHMLVLNLTHLKKATWSFKA